MRVAPLAALALGAGYAWPLWRSFSNCNLL